MKITCQPFDEIMESVYVGSNLSSASASHEILGRLVPLSVPPFP